MSTLLDLLKPALRLAGITERPGRGPSPDQTTEAIGVVNRMLASWSCNRLDIFKTSIDRYALSPIQTTYFIGPNGDFDAPRPIHIERANVVLLNTFPELHYHVHILDVDEWAAKTIPELMGGAWPYDLYDDYDVPDSKLYLYPLTAQPADLELFTWQELKHDFAALTDAVVLPTGYEEAIVLNLAVKIAAYYPKQATLDPDVRRQAGLALAAIESRNAPVPKMTSDTIGLGRGPRTAGDSNWWRSGGIV